MKIIDRVHTVDDDMMMRIVRVLNQVAKGHAIDLDEVSDLSADVVFLMEDGDPNDN